MNATRTGAIAGAVAVLFCTVIVLAPALLLEWRVVVALVVAFVSILALALAVGKVADIIRERDELEIDNRSMRQRLTVARSLVESAIPLALDAIEFDRQRKAWKALRDRWLRDEDADLHAVAMRDRVERLKAERELDAIRS